MLSINQSIILSLIIENERRCCLFWLLLLFVCLKCCLVAILVRMRLAHAPDRRKQGRAIDVQQARLEGEQQQEGHHQTEQTHGLGQGEAQNGVGEQLLFQRWVPGVADDEGTEYCSDTSTGSSDTDCCGTSTNEFGGRVNVTRDWRGLE